MNRLIIVGNGFDIAHGLETSYNSFILDYLLEIIDIACESDFIYEDVLSKEVSGVKPNLLIMRYELKAIKGTMARIEYILNNFKRNNLFSFNHNLFSRLLFEQVRDLKWVDIELCYFNVLNWIADESGRDILNDNSEVFRLNQQFEFLKSKLIKYIVKIDKYANPIDSINQKLVEPVKSITSNDESLIQNVHHILILNFNYTRIPDLYQRNLNALKIINIHGDILENSNKPIFGWGDDTNDAYRKIENLNNPNYLKYLKSLEYLKNDNYSRLLRFIENNEFQVQIMGHSCGVSDRTMLTTIFGHKNCFQIKPFYHQRSDRSDDFEDKIMEMSRHFNDKQRMRQIIVNKAETTRLTY